MKNVSSIVKNDFVTVKDDIYYELLNRNKNKKGKILDVGCGWGRFFYFFEKSSVAHRRHWFLKVSCSGLCHFFHNPASRGSTFFNFFTLFTFFNFFTFSNVTALSKPRA